MVEMADCPKCKRRECMVVLRRMRTNYPFGKHSKPVKIVKKRIEFCNHCGYSNEQTAPPLLNADKDWYWNSYHGYGGAL